MSWDSYVERLMEPLATGSLDSAAIIGQDGGVWAQSEKFPAVTADQISAIMKGFASIETVGHAGELGGTGILLGQEKFQVAPGDESVIRGKSSTGGCCIKKTVSALLIGIYSSPVQPGDVNKAVENLGDYLAGSGY